ncbi:MAG: hypothetical protein IPI60_08465 [Saprospiraceae bacterium]|nr:hypothetical protein [Saprospiraceae bacterium]
MAYSEILADRIRDSLVNQENVVEKKMMGGLTFMVNDKMCVVLSLDFNERAKSSKKKKSKGK